MFRVLNSVFSQIQNAKLNLFKMSHPAKHVEAAWYVGMAIHPADFSQQLSRMQLSMQVERTPVEARVAQK